MNLADASRHPDPDPGDPEEAWAALTDELRAAGERLARDLADASPVERADGYRALLRALNNQLGRFEVDRERPELADVGRFQAEQTERWFRRAQAFRTSPVARRVTVLDLAYDDLVGDPAAAVRTVYAAAGMDPPGDVDAFVAAHHEAQPRHAHGQHRYGPEDFGLEPGAIRERFAFLTN